MGSWVRTITTPFRKACTILGPQRDGKKPQQQSSAMVRHVDAERAKLHGEVMACAYEDVQVMWSMLDRPGTDPEAQQQLVTGADRLFMHPTNGYDDKE